MSREELETILALELGGMRHLRYAELRQRLGLARKEVTSGSGTRYLVDTQVYYTDPSRETELRVTVQVSPPGFWGALRIQTGDFTIRSDGSLAQPGR